LSRGNKSIIHAVKKKQTRNADAPKLDRIQNNAILPILREESITDNRSPTKNKVHQPDFKIKKLVVYPDGCLIPYVLAEHDTVKIHGELGFEDTKTQKRNMDYWITRTPFFVINEDLARFCKLDESGLFTYLYYHTLSQFHAFWKAEDELTY